MQPLKKWIGQQRKLQPGGAPETAQESVAHEDPAFEDVATPSIFLQEMPQPEKPAMSGQNLLRLFTRDKLPPTTIPSSSQSLDEDSAARLKSLLSIGVASAPRSAPTVSQPLKMLPTFANSNANNLLALLRRPSSMAPEVQTTRPYPSASVDRASLLSDDQRRPPHSHYSLEESAPNPRVSIAEHAIHDSQSDPSLQSSMNRDSKQYQDPAAMRRRMPIQQTHKPSAEPRFLGQTSGKQAEPGHVQAPRPYQHTGDPQFARSLQADDQFGFRIPSASQLHAPKLSSHAQSLLDVFKSSSSSTSRSIGPPHSSFPSTLVPPQAQRPASGKKFLDTGCPPLLGQPESRSGQSLSQPVPSRTNVQPVPVEETRFAVAHHPGANASTQKNALLDLFRTSTGTLKASEPRPSEPRPPEARPLEPWPLQSSLPEHRGITPGPVELSASRSPALAPQGIFTSNTPQILKRVSKASIEPFSSQEHRVPPLVKPAVLHPPAVTELGTERRKAKPTRSPKVSSPNVFSASHESDTGTVRRKVRGPRATDEQVERGLQQPPLAGPIQILKRPVTEPKPEAAEHSPEKVSRTLTPAPIELRGSSPIRSPRKTTSPRPASTKPTPSKPFQPQILRRPQLASPAPALPPDISDTLALPQISSNPSDVPVAAVESTTPCLPHIEQQAAQSPAPSAAIGLTNIFDRPADAPADQKSALLNLFNRSKALATAVSKSQSQTEQAASVSPISVSPPPSIFALSQTKPVTNSATASAMPPPPMDLSRSNINSMLKERPRSGSQTPISPSDRGFLLNYLRGL